MIDNMHRTLRQKQIISPNRQVYSQQKLQQQERKHKLARSREIRRELAVEKRESMWDNAPFCWRNPQPFDACRVAINACSQSGPCRHWLPLINPGACWSRIVPCRPCHSCPSHEKCRLLPNLILLLIVTCFLKFHLRGALIAFITGPFAHIHLSDIMICCNVHTHEYYHSQSDQYGTTISGTVDDL